MSAFYPLLLFTTLSERILKRKGVLSWVFISLLIRNLGRF